MSLRRLLRNSIRTAYHETLTDGLRPILPSGRLVRFPATTGPVRTFCAPTTSSPFPFPSTSSVLCTTTTTRSQTTSSESYENADAEDEDEPEEEEDTRYYHQHEKLVKSSMRHFFGYYFLFGGTLTVILVIFSFRWIGKIMEQERAKGKTKDELRELQMQVLRRVDALLEVAEKLVDSQFKK